MKKLLMAGLILLLVGSLSAQIPVFTYGNYNDRSPCEVKIFSATDTMFTSEIIYWDNPYFLFTGAVTLAGGMDLISGADTLCTMQARLVMRYRAETTGNSGTAIYDSTGWHTLATGSGNYIPAEDAVTSTYHPFSVELANEDWWKPCIGIQLRFWQHPMASGTKELEAYLIPNRYSY